MDTSALEVSAEKRQELMELVRRHGIRLLVAFGSQVKGQTHAASDLDLAVLLHRPGGGDDPMRLAADLQRLFPGRDVDVVWLHRADPLLSREIFQRAQLLYGDPQDMLRYRMYAWRRFVEYGRFFALEADAVRRGIDRLRRARR